MSSKILFGTGSAFAALLALLVGIAETQGAEAQGTGSRLVAIRLEETLTHGIVGVCEAQFTGADQSKFHEATVDFTENGNLLAARSITLPARERRVEDPLVPATETFSLFLRGRDTVVASYAMFNLSGTALDIYGCTIQIDEAGIKLVEGQTSASLR